MMREQKPRWDAESVLDVLKEFWEDIEDWDSSYSYYGKSGWLPATWDRPALFFDYYDQKLYIEFPDDYEELPNPNSSKFYPDFAEEIKSPDDLKKFFDEKTVEKIIKECGDDIECMIEKASEAHAEWLRKELEEEIKKIENSMPEYKNYCDVTVIKRKDIYEETRSDETGEYTAYIPSILYIIDLDKVPDKKTLECIIEKIMGYT